MDKEHIDTKLLETLFNEKGFSPNKAQRDAILHTEGPLFLTAGPGSGKTRVLLWRTLNLIVTKNVKPNEIFLATFTEKAAKQLKEGLQGLLSMATRITNKPYDISEMYVGTLHSLCLKLITERRFRTHHERNRRPMLMDDLDQYLYVYHNLNNILDDANDDNERNSIIKYLGENRSKGSTSKNETTKCLISYFNRMAEEDMSDAELEAYNGNDEMIKYLNKLTVRYRNLFCTGNTKRTDFAHLQQSTYEYISATTIDDVFKYVIVDEYQDTNTIQQKIYFKLAQHYKNICVVGDDDQALYRFRGATVENLVRFETNCASALGIKPKRIDLNINYRSRKQIVDTYTKFMDTINWHDTDHPEVSYRVENKNITANSTDNGTSVVVECGAPDVVASNIANTIKEMKENGTITDYNQCAVLFSSLKNKPPERFKEAFEQVGIPVYAPRMKGFLYTQEALVVFGLFAQVFQLDLQDHGFHQGFTNWIQRCFAASNEVCRQDKMLQKFIESRSEILQTAGDEYTKLLKTCEKKGYDLNSHIKYHINVELSKTKNLREETKNFLLSPRFNVFVSKAEENGRPLSIAYALARATAVDWTLLDLFYQLTFFKWFKTKFDDAQKNDESDAPLYNLAMVSKYIAKFIETSQPIITGAQIARQSLEKQFWNQYLYLLFRRDEKEYEDEEDPFPKGCVPFLTIHQAKGLEFPVVILGSARHDDKKARTLDIVVKTMRGGQSNEPIDRYDEFDTMRMFYVALSRPKNLLMIAQFRGAGQSTYKHFKTLFAQTAYTGTDSLDIDTIPKATETSSDIAHVYYYTADYLPYLKCARQYMVFRKYGFVPSRSQTMFFGSLIHETVEDLEQYIIAAENNLNQ